MFGLVKCSVILAPPMASAVYGPAPASNASCSDINDIE